MAKKRATSKGGVNVSEQIRAAWDADRSAKPTAIAAQLKAGGIKTNPGTVSTILSQYRKKLGLKRGRKGGRRRGGVVAGNTSRDSATSTNGSVSGSISSVIEAFKLVAKAKELVGAAGLRELVKAV